MLGETSNAVQSVVFEVAHDQKSPVYTLKLNPIASKASLTNLQGDYQNQNARLALLVADIFSKHYPFNLDFIGQSKSITIH